MFLKAFSFMACCLLLECFAMRPFPSGYCLSNSAGPVGDGSLRCDGPIRLCTSYNQNSTYFRMIVRFLGLAISCCGEGATNLSKLILRFCRTWSVWSVRLRLVPRLCLMTISFRRSRRVSSPSCILSSLPRQRVPDCSALASLSTLIRLSRLSFDCYTFLTNASTCLSERSLALRFCISASSCPRYFVTSSACVCTDSRSRFI